jgi:hypothetical protein
LIRRDDDVFEPVGPSESKTESRITETSSEGAETTSNGDPSSHLTDGGHDDPDEKTNETVCNQNRTGTSLSKGLAGSDNETSTKSTTYR